MVKSFSITNKDVLDILEEAATRNQASKLIETAILYYKESANDGYVKKEEVRSLVLECLKGVPVIQGSISNCNYLEGENELSDAIEDILGL